MDHREQMQKEAEQWQGTSVKIIQRVRYGVAAVALLGLLVIFVQNMGFPRQINETLPASVITADGQMLEISLNLKGEVTHYPLKAGKVSMGDQITVCVSGSDQILARLNLTTMDNFFYSRRNDMVCILSYERDHLLMETDLQYLFPDMESGTCLVSFGNGSFDLPGEYAQYFTLLNP